MANDISEVPESNMCCACGACEYRCPIENCIEFSVSNAGRLQPVVNQVTCIDCGACRKVCPDLVYRSQPKKVLSQGIDPFVGEIVSCYVGRAKDQKVYKNSQSGGFVTTVLSHLFRNSLIDGAVVVRGAEKEIDRPEAVLIEDVKDLYSSQKSQYLHVEILSFLKTVEKKSIAFVGLPCHIEGLRNLCSVDRRLQEKIKFTFGLICEGVFSHRIVDYFASMVNMPKNETQILFKDKHRPNYISAQVKVTNKATMESRFISNTERFKAKEILTPPRCLICYNKMNIFADAVFGDPWGIDGINVEKGESIVLCRTQQMDNLVHDMRRNDLITIRQVEPEAAIKGQKITEKRTTWLSYVRAYQKLGLAIPEHYLKIEKWAGTIDPKDLNYAEKRISQFLALEKIAKLDTMMLVLRCRVIYNSISGKIIRIFNRTLQLSKRLNIRYFRY
jgi:coenzyme F420 hydrogenase subunit beta